VDNIRHTAGFVDPWIGYQFHVPWSYLHFAGGRDHRSGVSIS
jgi:hypothetical protein